MLRAGTALQGGTFAGASDGRSGGRPVAHAMGPLPHTMNKVPASCSRRTCTAGPRAARLPSARSVALQLRLCQTGQQLCPPAGAQVTRWSCGGCPARCTA